MSRPNLINMFALPREIPETSRRGFLKIAGGAGAGLVLGLAAPLPGLAGAASAADTKGASAFQPNPFLIIAPDNTVTVIINKRRKNFLKDLIRVLRQVPFFFSIILHFIYFHFPVHL